MILGLILALALQNPVADDHEYSDLLKISASDVLQEYLSENPTASTTELENLGKLFQFHDFFGTALDGRNINFHLPSEPGHKPAKILLLSYTAEWCVNCNYEAPYLGELYDKYHSKGLEIVTRTEYSEVDKVREFIGRHEMKYPVIIGSIVAYDDRENIRMETFQYLLRNALGDSRKWGTPFNIIVIDGDIGNPYVVVGEMKSDQVNDLIERTLSGTQ
jgi:thiol-disulfide isomerase/thioredoxin